MTRASARDLHTIARLLLVLALSVGIGVAYQRCKSTPEQDDLQHFVELELPSVLKTDRQIQGTLEQLLSSPSTKPADARTLIADDVMPRIAKLRATAAVLGAKTSEVQRLKDGYLLALDRLAEACRVIVRTIDDPKLTSADALAKVRRELAEVSRVYGQWNERAKDACVTHGLAQPAALTK